jgi:hypothetical protein
MLIMPNYLTYEKHSEPNAPARYGDIHVTELKTGSISM